MDKKQKKAKTNPINQNDNKRFQCTVIVTLNKK